VSGLYTSNDLLGVAFCVYLGFCEQIYLSDTRDHVFFIIERSVAQLQGLRMLANDLDAIKIMDIQHLIRTSYRHNPLVLIGVNHVQV
jgi:hypothetical protein